VAFPHTLRRAIRTAETINDHSLCESPILAWLLPASVAFQGSQLRRAPIDQSRMEQAPFPTSCLHWFLCEETILSYRFPPTLHSPSTPPTISVSHHPVCCACSYKLLSHSSNRDNAAIITSKVRFSPATPALNMAFFLPSPTPNETWATTTLGNLTSCAEESPAATAVPRDAAPADITDPRYFF
jgi:hypothetical protein